MANNFSNSPLADLEPHGDAPVVHRAAPLLQPRRQRRYPVPRHILQRNPLQLEAKLKAGGGEGGGVAVLILVIKGRSVGREASLASLARGAGQVGLGGAGVGPAALGGGRGDAGGLVPGLGGRKVWGGWSSYSC